MGRYSAVLRRHGKQGFGIPEKAPDVGSFPLYPVKRARFALTIISSGGWDAKKKLRAQISKRAVAAHPSLRSYWNQLRRETIEPRMDGSTSTRSKAAANPRRNTMARRQNAGHVRILRNPLGMPLGKGQAVRVEGGKRTHILNPRTGRALCDSQGRYGPLSPSAAKSIDCYRCIKIRTVDGGDDVERIFAPGPGQGKRETHMMVPGGRQGRYVSGVKPSDVIGGIDMFLGGDFDDPTQSRTLSRAQKAARRTAIRKGRFKMVQKRAPAIRGRGEMVANPRSYQQGYQRGSQDYHKPTPIAASQLTQRTISYQTSEQHSPPEVTEAVSRDG
jgi:hypothetical protein